MKDTVIKLCESTILPEVDFITENTAALNILDRISAEENMATSYVAEKVIVNKSKDSYLIEFNENLERFMLDQDMGIIEAVQCVADVNNIAVNECKVIFDERSLERIKIADVIKADPDFDIVRR